MKERELFEAGLSIEDDQARDAFLSDRCGGDSRLKRRIMQAIEAHRQLGSFLEEPAVNFDVSEEPGLESPGQMIGPYQLKELLGAGGMGVVWAAVQQEPIRRKVAIKLIKPGMDTEQVLARFEAEREALSLMDHPNIAQVLDAGTTVQGRPYFVMELIRGKPITEYCDSLKLAVAARLRLFVQVCRAVQHAHQKGIIHRDIKPLNVLVTEKDGEPMPKIIDFGVAKALYQPLTDRSIYTAVFHAIGTMAYMSPEQAGLSATDVDSRADVYGLGTLLYELLTGHTPFDKQELAKAAFEEACRTIREKDPIRPSATVGTMGARATSISEQRRTSPHKLEKTIRGEIDWIVLKALEKDRNRRYDSAGALGDDVSRYLTGDPVSVSPPSTVYRLCRFARRHYVAIAVGILLSALLLAGTTVFGTLTFRFRRLFTDKVATEKQLRQRTHQLEESIDALGDRNYALGVINGFEELSRSNPRKAAESLQRVRRQCELDDRKFGIEGQLLLQRLNCDYAQHGGVWSGEANPFVRPSFSHDSAYFAVPMEGRVQIVDVRSRAERVVGFHAFDSQTVLTAISSVYSPIEDTLVIGVKTADRRGRLFQLDASGLSQVAELEVEPRRITFSPQGDRVLVDTGGGGGPPPKNGVRMYATSDWTRLWKLDRYVGEPVFIDEGRQFVTMEDGMFYVRDSSTSEGLEPVPGWYGPVHVHLAPENEFLLTTDELRHGVWSVDPIRWIGSTPRTGGSLMAFSRETPVVVARQKNRRAVEVREWETNRLIREVYDDVDVERLVISPNGDWMATIALNDRVTLWDIRKERQPLTESAFLSWFITLASAPDGSHVSMPYGSGDVQVWSTTDGRTRRIENAHDKHVAGLDYSPDGKLLATGSFDGSVRIWDATTLELAHTLSDGLAAVWAVKFSRDGRRIASVGTRGQIRVWDVMTRQSVAEINDENEQRLLSVDFLPGEGDEFIVTTGESGRAKRWDLATREATTFQEVGPRVDTIKVSPFGDWIATANRAGVVTLYGTGDLHQRWQQKVAGSFLTSACFSQNGSRLICSAPDGLTFLHTADGKTLSQVRMDESIRHVLVMPNDRGLVTAGRKGAVRFWPLTDDALPAIWREEPD